MGEIDKLSYQKRPLHVIKPVVPVRLPDMRLRNHFLSASFAKQPDTKHVDMSLSGAPEESRSEVPNPAKEFHNNLSNASNPIKDMI